jgi:hypothetical protein
MLKVVLISLLTLALPAVAATAGPDCRCRGSDGRLFEQGELACIKTAKGQKLARCEMALNNSSWTLVGEDCDPTVSTYMPLAVAEKRMAAAIRSHMAAPHADLR